MFSAAHTTFIVCTILSSVFYRGHCIKCISCNSKKDYRCYDPFLEMNFYDIDDNPVKIIDCAVETSHLQTIEYLSKLVSALGVPVDTQKIRRNLTNIASFAHHRHYCQKVILNDEFGTTIRDCAIFTDIICDTFRYEMDLELLITFCDTCYEDYCNFSSVLVPHWMLIVSTSIISFSILAPIV